MDLVHGWTERIRYRLEAEDQPIDLGSLTVTLVARDKSGTAVSLSGTAGVDTPSTGIVYFDPAPGDIDAAKGPYYVRWRVTDGSKVAFFPAGPAEIWRIGLA